jgi:hypothetical protein
VERLLIALAIGVVAGLFALWLRRRRTVDAPTGGAGRVPTQLDRADFPRPDAPWLVAVFTSATCDACKDVRSKVEILESEDVAVVAVEFPTDRETHKRYGIDSVPLVVIAGADGVVQRHFLGPVTATDLWAAVAAERTPD